MILLIRINPHDLITLFLLFLLFPGVTVIYDNNTYRFEEVFIFQKEQA